MAKLNREKWKKSSFDEEKSLVGLTLAYSLQHKIRIDFFHLILKWNNLSKQILVEGQICDGSQKPAVSKLALNKIKIFDFLLLEKKQFLLMK